MTDPDRCWWDQGGLQDSFGDGGGDDDGDGWGNAFNLSGRTDGDGDVDDYPFTSTAPPENP